MVKLHTKLGKPIPPAEPQLIHGSGAKVAAGGPATAAALGASTSSTPAAGTAATSSSPSVSGTPGAPPAPSTTTSASVPASALPGTAKVTAVAPKINFLGINRSANGPL